MKILRGKELILLVVFFFQKSKKLKNYTGDAELYAHAFLRTRRYAPDFFCGSFLFVFAFDILPCLGLVFQPCGHLLGKG